MQKSLSHFKIHCTIQNSVSFQKHNQSISHVLHSILLFKKNALHRYNNIKSISQFANNSIFRVHNLTLINYTCQYRTLRKNGIAQNEQMHCHASTVMTTIYMVLAPTLKRGRYLRSSFAVHAIRTNLVPFESKVSSEYESGGT